MQTLRTRLMGYYKSMAEAPKPAVAIVEDMDYPKCIGAFWGEVNGVVHKSFGMSGALKNGVLRDLGDVPPVFPVIAGSIGPSHGFVHVRLVNQPMRIMGMQVPRINAPPWKPTTAGAIARNDVLRASR